MAYQFVFHNINELQMTNHAPPTTETESTAESAESVETTVTTPQTQQPDTIRFLDNLLNSRFQTQRDIVSLRLCSVLNSLGHEGMELHGIFHKLIHRTNFGNAKRMLKSTHKLICDELELSAAAAPGPGPDLSNYTAMHSPSIPQSRPRFHPFHEHNQYKKIAVEGRLQNLTLENKKSDTETCLLWYGMVESWASGYSKKELKGLVRLRCHYETNKICVTTLNETYTVSVTEKELKRASHFFSVNNLENGLKCQ
eukprot:395401_1